MLIGTRCEELFLARRALPQLLNSILNSKKGDFKTMHLIRYQTPEATPWLALDRWSNLKDELNSFFDMPFWSGFGRTGQLFTGWSPALDLYESGDHLTAVVELPGMRKEDIDISLHDGTLTVSGERKRESSQRRKSPAHRALRRHIPPQHRTAHACGRQ